MSIIINTMDLIPLNAFEGRFPFKIHVAYADAGYEHNQFKNLYHPEAKVMWSHKDFAAIPLLAAKIANRLYGWTFEFKDCFRPTEAQEKMAAYGFHETLVSRAGRGGHPRAMAIDIAPYDKDSHEIDMGTPFDYFTKDINDNPAARDYTNFENDQIVKNRKILESSMVDAAHHLGKKILPIPQEWWDFRLYPEELNQYAPMSENDVEPYQRMIDPDIAGLQKILGGEYPNEMAKNIEDVKRDVENGFQSFVA